MTGQLRLLPLPRLLHRTVDVEHGCRERTRETEALESRVADKASGSLELRSEVVIRLNVKGLGLLRAPGCKGTNLDLSSSDAYLSNVQTSGIRNGH